VTCGGGARLGTFELAGVLGGVKAEPLASERSREDSRALTPPARTGRGLGVLGRGRKGLVMTLEIYPVILELVRRLAPVVRVLRTRSAALGDQMERALVSIPLNVAEGAYSRGRNRQARFQSAAASARETLACLETAEAMGFVSPMDPELAALFHRVIGTLVRLMQPRR